MAISSVAPPATGSRVDAGSVTRTEKCCETVSDSHQAFGDLWERKEVEVVTEHFLYTRARTGMTEDPSMYVGGEGIPVEVGEGS